MLRREIRQAAGGSRPSYGSVGNQISRAMILHEVTFRELGRRSWRSSPRQQHWLRAAAPPKISIASLNIARPRRPKRQQGDCRARHRVSLAGGASLRQSCDRTGAGGTDPAFLSSLRGGATGVDVASTPLLAAHEAIAPRSQISDVETTRNGWSATSTTSSRATKCQAPTSTVRGGYGQGKITSRAS